MTIKTYSGYWNGLQVECEEDYHPGVRYYADGSGDPPTADYSFSFEIDNQAEFLDWVEDEAWRKDIPPKAFISALPWARIGVIRSEFKDYLQEYYFDELMGSIDF